MDDIKEGLKYVFQTRNPLTLCISASGHGGMEASMCNLIEEGDVVLCGVTGLWGRRAGDIASRYGADVRYVEAGKDEVLTMEQLNAYFEVHQPRIFFITQGDSSTGVLQPIDGLGELCRKYVTQFVFFIYAHYFKWMFRFLTFFFFIEIKQINMKLVDHKEKNN